MSREMYGSKYERVSLIPFEWSMHGTCSGEGEGKGEGEGRVGLWSRNGMTARFRVGPCSWQGTSPVGRKAMRPPLSVRSDGTCGEKSGQIQYAGNGRPVQPQLAGSERLSLRTDIATSCLSLPLDL